MRKALDPLDIAIIRHLQEDGRKSFAQIAAELNVSPSSVQQRANRLIREKAIVIKAIVHPADIEDVIMAMVAIKADGTKLHAVAQAISRLPEVRWVVICAGHYDILLELVCEGNEHLLYILSNKISVIEGVRETVTFPYLEVTKRTYEWVLPDLVSE
ncbi:MAG: Lrp/AsnC family transcriptional regulator [Anaerolineales bacterium]|nr:Lrp/AsnC family transcriptional regulator [Anaerolineales bacterium]MCS7248624.1 Lrp/AsnC family transcriptional regulator [Anaerolineales bacterium]MDW8162437.1 Lrp/AsnC family transcriptional regulator [Anaerolineales bacterium]MDW8446132.1 Lrp/AsnC family transcriptional regulator [Anaerolineales bacterium]